MSELINSGDPLDEDFPKGPALGEPFPDFELVDHSGRMVRFSEARGTDRALILFHRSASW